MNPEFITRVVGLVQKTNERVVLADPQTGKAVVVMDFDSYERLLNVAPALAAAPTAPAPQIKAETPVERPVTRLPNPPAAEKTAMIGEIPVKTRVHVAVKEQTRRPAPRQDLTQDAVGDNMNRDTGTWKTAQPRLSEALRPVPVSQSAGLSASVIEEEERFYLEPIE